jgi:hypothetical protein
MALPTSLTLAAGASLLLGVFAAACSSGTDSPAAADDPGGTGDTSTGGDAGTDGGDSSLSQEQINACQQLQEQVTEQVEQATGEYQYPNTFDDCTTDDDCVVVSASTACGSACNQAIGKSHADAFNQAVAKANSQLCANVSGCPGETYCSKLNTAACYSGSCTIGFPAAWESFALESDQGGSGSTLPVTCSGTGCTLWLLTPDAKVAVSNGGATVRTATLSSADFAVVDQILRSTEFRQSTYYGTSCVKYDGPQHVSEAVLRGDVLAGADVSSCVAGMIIGPDAAPTPTNDYLTLYNVLKGY